MMYGIKKGCRMRSVFKRFRFGYGLMRIYDNGVIESFVKGTLWVFHKKVPLHPKYWFHWQIKI